MGNTSTFATTTKTTAGFMPDATLGVRSLSPNDLQAIGLNWLMVNTFIC